jgi:hypothetical protein
MSYCTGCQNLSNLTHQRTREMCQIVQDVRTCLIQNTKGPGKCVRHLFSKYRFCIGTFFSLNRFAINSTPDQMPVFQNKIEKFIHALPGSPKSSDHYTQVTFFLHLVLYSGTSAIRHLSFLTSCDMHKKLWSQIIYGQFRETGNIEYELGVSFISF